MTPPLLSRSSCKMVCPVVNVAAEAPTLDVTSVQFQLCPCTTTPLTSLDLLIVRSEALTECEAPAEVLPLKFVSPAYVAVSVRAPGVVSVILQVPAATVPMQLFTPSLTVTLPVGVPAPGALAVTVKLTVTAWPTSEGSGVSDVMVVVVSALLTV